ncbi:NLR family CARD domain-containing protein 3-like [Aplochiton taeniatus]
MTRGVAGIGKTVVAQKFILDWAEGRENQDLTFVFPLPFRELNLTRKNISLFELLCLFFTAIKESGISKFDEYSALFILDGLDECRFSLDFNSSVTVDDPFEAITIDVLLINLIKGNLLPSAHIWITSRPVAADQIPSEYVDRVTEVRGFNNPQKEEFFMKRVSNKNLASKMIAHVKSSRSLHIMCHIPVFCWMCATVLEEMLKRAKIEDMPKTLTQMYIRFLALQEETMNLRLNGRRESVPDVTKNNLMSLGRLAFHQLEKENLIFYEEDLRENGIDIEQASLFSGVYTQLFSQELTLCKKKVFCFVHLSIQEFLAALYVFLKFSINNVNVLAKRPSLRRLAFRDSPATFLYKVAVDRALQYKNGHFDVFLRFFLGLSLESNQDLIQNLGIKKRTSPKSTQEVTDYIKDQIRDNPSPERCLNLFHCLNELNDCSLVKEIQSFLSSGCLSGDKLSPAQWATLVFVLLTSEEELDVFDLSKYSRSEKGLLRLLPVVRASKVARLNGCRLTEKCCKILASSLASSQLRELDLSENNIRDGGIMVLSAGLRNCQLKTLNLRSCNLTEGSCEAINSVLSLDSSQLTVLDLSDNDLQDSGVKILASGIGSPYCKLEILRLSLCRLTEEVCVFLASAVNSNPSHLRELDLSYNHPGDSGHKLLSAMLEDPHCRLERLSVDCCGESTLQSGPQRYTRDLRLDPNTAHRDLALSEGNKKAKWGIKQPYPEHPERFDIRRQVLCTQGLTGRCYWEVEWSGRALIGVAYKRIHRKGEGNECSLGRNAESWGLSCNIDSYNACHGDKTTAIAIPPDSRRIGVYLDWSAGTLSFSKVCSGTLTTMHTFSADFSEPLYPGFRFGWVDSFASLC